MSVVDGTYCNSADVTNLTGYFHKTMLTFGREMTEGEYEMFVSGLVRTATELVNRWCNVSTFYSHEITDEYHTMNIDDLYMYSDYILRPYGFGYSPYSIDMEVKRKQFYPREYPVISVSKVLVNRASVYADPQWMELVQRTTEVGGDYLVQNRFNSTRVQILKNIPTPGTDNVRITYTAGYESTDSIFLALSSATSMIVINYLNYKKKNQEASTFRQSGVVDFAEMFNPQFASFLLTADVKSILELYRRPPIDPQLYV